MEGEFDLAYIRSWSSERGSGAISLSVSTNEDFMAVGFKSNDVGTFDLTKIIP